MVSTMVLMNLTTSMFVSWATRMHSKTMASGASFASVSIMTTFSKVEAMQTKQSAAARCSVEGLMTYSPFRWQTLVVAMGPFQGTSEQATEMDAPRDATISTGLS